MRETLASTDIEIAPTTAAAIIPADILPPEEALVGGCRGESCSKVSSNKSPEEGAHGCRV